MSNETTLREAMKTLAFVIRPDGTKGCYSLTKFNQSGNGWVCRLSDADDMMLVSADIEYCLRKALDRQYPLTITNLNFALDKAGLPRCSDTDIKELTWCERASKFFTEVITKLPHAIAETMAFGEDFIMIRINSVKQAKKIMKSREVRDAPYIIDRRKKQIVIINEAVLMGGKE